MSGIDEQARSEDFSVIAPEHLDKFTWHEGDLQIEPSNWTVGYRDGDATVLVQGLDGLVQHLMQQPGFDGDLRTALDRCCAANAFRFAPPKLVAEILAATSHAAFAPLPRTPQGKPRWGDGTARHGYGVRVFERDAYRCRYCERDLAASFDAWLTLSVDHVVPAQMAKPPHDYPKALVEDEANLVTCCRACNDIGNRFTVPDPCPDCDEAFFDVRDRVFVQRRARVRLARELERRTYYDKIAGSRQPQTEPEAEG